MTLQASDDELKDLEHNHPMLVDAGTGEPTGITLDRRIGHGGMSTVFLGRTDGAARSRGLPPEVAVKFLQASTARRLKKMNMEPEELIKREVEAHKSVMRVLPPTPYVIGCYASGLATITIDRGGGNTSPGVELPWIVLEYVDGGKAGTSLEERVQANGTTSVGGFDATRALRLVTGLTAGLRVLHAATPIVIHRDLKPQNILVAGPVDDETPKIADFGIARLQGLGAGPTVHAADLLYAPYEQLCGIPGERNLLIGPWTDVHALAAVIWFVLTGLHWGAEAGEAGWRRGDRPSLVKSRQLHSSLRREEPLLEKIQAVLARGASAKLPESVDPISFGELGAAARYVRALPQLNGPPRYADATQFGAAVVPLLQELEDNVRRRATAAGALAPTLFRPTQLLRLQDITGPLVEVEVAAKRGSPLEADPQARVVVIAGAGALARLNGTLSFFLGDQAQDVPLDVEAREALRLSPWLVRAPSGFAAVGQDFLLIEHGTVRKGELPRHDGKTVGRVQAVHGDANGIIVATAETDESDGPELWRTTDGRTWRGPTVIEQGPSTVNAMAPGPGGILVVGGNKKGDKARAALVGFDDKVRELSVPDGHAALRTAICGTGVEAWGAGDGYVLRFHVKQGSDRTAESERVDVAGPAVAMALDPIGTPWLVTSHAVLRRHLDGVDPVWRLYYKRAPAEAALVGVGFEARAAIVMDAAGVMLRLKPRDAGTWGSSTPGDTG